MKLKTAPAMPAILGKGVRAPAKQFGKTKLAAKTKSVEGSGTVLSEEAPITRDPIGLLVIHRGEDSLSWFHGYPQGPAKPAVQVSGATMTVPLSSTEKPTFNP